MVQITVLGSPRPALRARITGARTRIAIGVVVAGAMVVALLASSELGGGPRAARADRDGARAGGPAGVAAAYGYPLRCLSVAIATHDPRFARADFDRSVPCGRYAGYSTAIFRRTGAMWVAVLEAISYACPARTIPAQVEEELGVCLRGPTGQLKDRARR